MLAGLAADHSESQNFPLLAVESEKIGHAEVVAFACLGELAAVGLVAAAALLAELELAEQ